MCLMWVTRMSVPFQDNHYSCCCLAQLAHPTSMRVQFVRQALTKLHAQGHVRLLDSENPCWQKLGDANAENWVIMWGID
jgi:hypothetical protein